MMPRLSVLLLLALAASSLAVRVCYKCSGCDEGQRGHPVECASFQHSCYKLVLGTRVEKGCADGATCSIQDLERGISGALSSLTGDRRHEDPSSRVAHCCSHDYCNGAGAAYASPALCAAALAALLARLAL